MFAGWRAKSTVQCFADQEVPTARHRYCEGREINVTKLPKPPTAHLPMSLQACTGTDFWDRQAMIAP